MLSELLLDALLDMRDECPDIGGGSGAEVHDDVRMQMRDLRVANAISLQPTLIDQASRANILDLLEDGSGTGMNVQPGVPRASPGKVLLKDAVHAIAVAWRQSKLH